MGQASQITIQDMNMSEDLFSNTTCQLGMTGMAIYTRICANLDYFYLRKVWISIIDGVLSTANCRQAPALKQWDR